MNHAFSFKWTTALRLRFSIQFDNMSMLYGTLLFFLSASSQLWEFNAFNVFPILIKTIVKNNLNGD